MQPMLHEHTPWVLKQLSVCDIQDKPKLDLPESIDLMAVKQKWALDYRPSSVSGIQLREQGFTLAVIGGVDGMGEEEGQAAPKTLAFGCGRRDGPSLWIGFCSFAKKSLGQLLRERKYQPECKSFVFT